MMQVNFISDPNHKQPEMDGEADREGWKMAIHYLTIRLSKWAGSQTVPSCMRHLPSDYKYICEFVWRWGLWEILGTTYSIMHCNESTQAVALRNKHLSNIIPFIKAAFTAWLLFWFALHFADDVCCVHVLHEYWWCHTCVCPWAHL